MHDQRGHASICRSRSREWRRGGGNKSMWLFKGRNAWLLDLALCMWEQSCIIWVLRHQQWVYAWWNWMSWFYLIFKIWMRKKKQKPVCVLHKCLIESKDDTLLISVHVLIMKLVLELEEQHSQELFPNVNMLFLITAPVFDQRSSDVQFPVGSLHTMQQQQHDRRQI